MRLKPLLALLAGATVGTSLLLTGCSRGDRLAEDQQAEAVPQRTPAASGPVVAQQVPTSAQVTSPDEEHGHVPGQHGGIIVSLGRDSYHAEAVFEKGGLLRLYMLGSDETRIQEVDAQDLKAFAKPTSGSESLAFELKPEPQDGDAEGKTSVFVGKLPEDIAGGELDVTVPNIRIGGERFRLGFTSAPPQQHGDEMMPEKVADDAERELYLTAAGIYTAEDIAANGNVTASEKFRGFRAKHDMHPKPGDKICPVTMTKANPECTWIVGGKEYEFCCPPCVDEFVAWAKDPERLKDVASPEDYIKR